MNDAGRRSRLPVLTSIVLVGIGTTACQPANVPGSTALRSSWMFGIERMRGDPAPQLPYTNQFIVNLAAMPNVQIVSVDDDRNRLAFNAWTGGKVLVSPWLHGEGNCMNITYTVFESGQHQQTCGDQWCATEALTAMDRNGLSLGEAQFERCKQFEDGAVRRWDAAVFDGNRHKGYAVGPAGVRFVLQLEGRCFFGRECGNGQVDACRLQGSDFVRQPFTAAWPRHNRKSPGPRTVYPICLHRTVFLPDRLYL